MTGFKKVAVFFLLIALGGVLSAQGKPRLGILPFTGGFNGEGETVALFFSYAPEWSPFFTIIPRLSTLETLQREPQFQQSTGLTDADTLVRLSRPFNVDYVMTGHIRPLGEGKVLLLTLIQVERYRQIAGAYRIYTDTEELREMIPDLVQSLALTSRRNAAGSPPRLAVLPVTVPPELDQADMELLVHLLSMEIANSGHYAVTPRPGAVQTIMAEQRIKRSMAADPESIKTIGRALNVQNVLSNHISLLDETLWYIASILKTVDASQSAGTAADYQALTEDFELIRELESILTTPVYPARDLPAFDPLMFRRPGYRYLIPPALLN
jgi:hypothetical protein